MSVQRSTPAARPDRRLHRAMAALVLSAAVAVTGCSKGAPSNDELSQALVDAGVPKEQAHCVSKAILDDLPDQQIEKIIEIGPAAAPSKENVGQRALDRYNDAMTRCRAMTPTTVGTAATTTPVATSTSTTTSPSTTAAP